MQKISMKERIENAIKNQPDRYVVIRDKNSEICEFHDKDTGYVWKRFFENGEEHWMWIS